MAEPSSTVLGLTTVLIPIGAAVFGLDVERAIGALAGATVFVFNTEGAGIRKRFAYLLISIIVGYAAAPDVMARASIESKVFTSFLVAAGALAATIGFIQVSKTGEIFKILKSWRVK